jgi:hypothetical protein
MATFAFLCGFATNKGTAALSSPSSMVIDFFKKIVIAHGLVHYN